jgi:hypothetical protein
MKARKHAKKYQGADRNDDVESNIANPRLCSAESLTPMKSKAPNMPTNPR